MFDQSVKTNIDVEGWHRSLNMKARVAAPLYTLVGHLFNEATNIEGKVRLVSEMRLRRPQRQSYRTMQAKICEAWEGHRANELTATSLLKKVSTIYKPRIARRDDADKC